MNSDLHILNGHLLRGHLSDLSLSADFDHPATMCKPMVQQLGRWDVNLGESEWQGPIGDIDEVIGFRGEQDSALGDSYKTIDVQAGTIPLALLAYTTPASFSAVYDPLFHYGAIEAFSLDDYNQYRNAWGLTGTVLATISSSIFMSGITLSAFLPMVGVPVAGLGLGVAGVVLSGWLLSDSHLTHADRAVRQQRVLDEALGETRLALTEARVSKREKLDWLRNHYQMGRDEKQLLNKMESMQARRDVYMTEMRLEHLKIDMLNLSQRTLEQRSQEIDERSEELLGYESELRHKTLEIESLERKMRNSSRTGFLKETTFLPHPEVDSTPQPNNSGAYIPPGHSPNETFVEKLERLMAEKASISKSYYSLQQSRDLAQERQNVDRDMANNHEQLRSQMDLVNLKQKEYDHDTGEPLSYLEGYFEADTAAGKARDEVTRLMEARASNQAHVRLMQLLTGYLRAETLVYNPLLNEVFVKSGIIPNSSKDNWFSITFQSRTIQW